MSEKCKVCGVDVTPGPRQLDTPINRFEAAWSPAMNGYVCWTCDMLEEQTEKTVFSDGEEEFFYPAPPLEVSE